VDWDVHHGNGTQAAFYADPRVLFCSVHEWPLYPGSGSVNECGEGAGEGFTVNVPLPSGSRDGDYVRAFERVVEPIVGRFAPQAVLVSAGEDISLHDPLAGMLVSEAGFAQMALRCARLAQASAGGRLAFVLEGGYDRPATGRAVEAVLRAVADEEAPPASGLDVRAAAAVERAVQAQSAYWEL
jgi:acetoin utilization deacetylase AcuC-like enzyme